MKPLRKFFRKFDKFFSKTRAYNGRENATRSDHVRFSKDAQKAFKKLNSGEVSMLNTHSVCDPNQKFIITKEKGLEKVT